MRYALECNDHRVEGGSIAECFMELQQAVLRDGTEEELKSVLDNLRIQQEIALEAIVTELQINFREKF